MEEISFLQWLANGGLQDYLELVVKNNAFLLGIIYGIPKYFAVVLGKQGENKLIDLVGLGWNTAKESWKERKSK